jgi:thiol-disulfide isomerase/thioredoxin
MLLTVVAQVAASGAIAGCSVGGAQRAQNAIAGLDVVGLTTYAATARQAAPALEGRTLDDHQYSVPRVSIGKVVLVNVWASWCGPCRQESPMLAATAKSLEPKGALFVGIDERDSEKAARGFASSNGTPYESLVDRDGSLLRKLKTLPQTGIPSTLVLDKHGRIAARVVGPISSTEVTGVVEKLLNET